MPEDYESRLKEMFPGRFKKLKMLAPDRWVLSIAFKILRDVGEAQDVMQSVFLETHLAAAQFDASQDSTACECRRMRLPRGSYQSPANGTLVPPQPIPCESRRKDSTLSTSTDAFPFYSPWQNAYRLRMFIARIGWAL